RQRHLLQRADGDEAGDEDLERRSVPALCQLEQHGLGPVRDGAADAGDHFVDVERALAALVNRSGRRRRAGSLGDRPPCGPILSRPPCLARPPCGGGARPCHVITLNHGRHTGYVTSSPAAVDAGTTLSVQDTPGCRCLRILRHILGLGRLLTYAFDSLAGRRGWRRWALHAIILRVRRYANERRHRPTTQAPDGNACQSPLRTRPDSRTWGGGSC